MIQVFYVTVIKQKMTYYEGGLSVMIIIIENEIGD